MLNLHRWQNLSRSLGIAMDPATFYQLKTAYEEPHRFYHTTVHLLDCLALLDTHTQLAQYPEAVEVALWFHDAVHDPKRQDNETRSAIWASHHLQQHGAAAALIQRVKSMILATAGHGIATTTDTQLLLDIDLAILGQAPDRFDQYPQSIRQEYAWVPKEIYREKRHQVLGSFLARDFIYQTTAFRARYEAAARRNLARVLSD